MMNKGPALSLEVQQLAPEPPTKYTEYGGTIYKNGHVVEDSAEIADAIAQLEPPRDFLVEAMKIIRGETMMRPQKQHLEALHDQILGFQKFSFENAQTLAFNDQDCRLILACLVGWFGASRPSVESKTEFTNAMNYAIEMLP